MRPAYLPASLFAVALLLPTCCTQAAPPPNFNNLPAYLTALNQSQDPEAMAIKAQIAAGPADLARERAAADKAGLLTRPSPLQPPLPPTGQNAAPLYVQLDALRKQKPLHLPLYAQPLSGRYAHTPEQVAATQSVVDARQDIFSLLHQATDKPQCVFARAAPSPLGTPTDFTHYAGLREDAREINTESLLLAYQGHYSEAVTDQERGFRIAAHVASDNLLISFLVGTAVEAITLDGMQGILKKAGPDAALDSRVEADLLALPPLSLSHALSGELALADMEFSHLREANPAQITQLFASSALPAVDSGQAPVQFTPTQQAQWSRFVDASEADYLHQMRQLIPAADLPSAQREAVFGQAESRSSSSGYSLIERLSDLLNPVVGADAVFGSASIVSRLSLQVSQIAARREVAAAGAAVLAAKARTGTFPSALPPQFTDPFNSKPLGYRLESTNGFVVYSAGPSSTFDGGRPGDPSGTNILFRYPLAPVPLPDSMLH